MKVRQGQNAEGEVPEGLPTVRASSAPPLHPGLSRLIHPAIQGGRIHVDIGSYRR